MRNRPFDIFSQIPPHLKEMKAYQKSDPLIVFGSTMLSMQTIVPAGGVAVELIKADRPKLYMLTNIDSGNVFYIGGEGVTPLSGFPINSFERMVFGLMENTTLWVCANNQITAYTMDLGL